MIAHRVLSPKWCWPHLLVAWKLFCAWDHTVWHKVRVAGWWPAPTVGHRSWLQAQGEAAALSSDPSSPMGDQFLGEILLKCSKVRPTAQGSPGRGGKCFLALSHQSVFQPCQVASLVFKHVSHSTVNFSKSKLPKAKRKSPRRAYWFFPMAPHFLLCTKR